MRRINEEFVPVALKAGLLNNPPADEEGLLYREIDRSKPAPQGICIVNSSGKVLNWVLAFDDDPSLLAFLDHARKRYHEYPDANQPVPAEIHIRFPSQQRKDVADNGKVLPVLDHHAAGRRCPAEPPLPKGTVIARVFGRALDKEGKPIAETLRQEDYSEDRFLISVQTQERFLNAVAGAGTIRVPLPPEVTRPWVRQAYLGVLDVQPLDNPCGNSGELRRCEFRAKKIGTSRNPTLWRIDGESEVFIDHRMAHGTPGDMHSVKLKWQGFVETDGNRLTRLMLLAAGSEKLRFGLSRGKDGDEEEFLPTGRPIDMACDVRFGILGEPAVTERGKP